MNAADTKRNPWQKPGTRIELVAEQMQQKADKTGERVVFVFNEVSIVAYPGLCSTETIAAYWIEVLRRVELLRRSRETGLYKEDKT